MKTLLIIDPSLGQARAYLAKTLLGTAAQNWRLLSALRSRLTPR